MEGQGGCWELGGRGEEGVLTGLRSNKEDLQILSCRLGVVWYGLVLVITIKYKSSPLYALTRVCAYVCVCWLSVALECSGLSRRPCPALEGWG